MRHEASSISKLRKKREGGGGGGGEKQTDRQTELELENFNTQG